VRLEDIRLAASMLDWIVLQGRCCVVELGIDTDGVKHPVGLWDGSTENVGRRPRSYSRTWLPPP